MSPKTSSPVYIFILLPIPLLLALFTDGPKNHILFSLLFLSIAAVFFMVFHNRQSLSIPYPYLTLFISLLIMISTLKTDYLYIGISRCTRILSYYTYFIVLYNTRDKKLFTVLYMILALSGILTAVTVCIQFAFYTSQPMGLFSANANYSGTLIAITIVLLMCFFFSRSADLRFSIPTVLVIVLLSIALLLTRARGPVIGLYGGIIALLAVQKKYRLIFYFILFSVVILVLIPGNAIISQVLHWGFEWKKNPWGRFAIWNTALLIIAHHPLLGIGPGHFVYGYLQHRVPYGEGISRYINTTPLAHNDFLQLCAGYGIPVFLIFCFLTLKPLMCSLKNNENTGLSTASVICLTVIAISSIFNFPLYLPYFNLLVALFLSHLVQNAGNQNKAVTIQCVKPVLIRSCLVIAGMFLVLDSLSDLGASSIVVPAKTSPLIKASRSLAQSATPDNFTQTLSKIRTYSDRIKELNPLDSQYAQWVGKIYYSAFTITRFRPYFIYALQNYIDAVQFDEHNPFHYFHLGNMYRAQKYYALAAAMFSRALAQEPYFLRALLRLADCKARMGLYAQAQQLFDLHFQYQSLIKTHYTSQPYVQELLKHDMTEFYRSYAALLLKTGKKAEYRAIQRKIESYEK